MGNAYPCRHVENAASEGRIYFDSVFKQRVCIVKFDSCGVYDYFVELQPVRCKNLVTKHHEPYALHAKEIPNRFKVIGRI